MSRILVAVDHDQAVQRIVAAVRTMFAGTSTEATVLHVRERQPRGVVYLSRLDAERLVDDTVESLRRNGVPADGRLHVCLPGCVSLAILKIAFDEGARAIVVGTYRRSRVARWLQGSVSRSVIRRATVPVLAVPLGRWQATSPEPGDPGRLAVNVVALDFKARLHRPHEPVA